MWEQVRKNAGLCVTGLILVLLIVAGVLVWRFWDWLRMGVGGYESGTATVRNLGLLVTAIIALPLGIWRSFVAYRQSLTAHQGLLNERYQKGAEMLGSEVLSVRLGGVYALSRLAKEHPEQYHVSIIKLFCAFARNPTKDDRDEIHLDGEKYPRLREDIQAVMTAIGSRSKVGIGYENAEGFELDLLGADLHRINLPNANLSGANLRGVNLEGANFLGADLSGAELISVNLSGANLINAKLSGSSLLSADLSDTISQHTDFSGADLGSANLTHAHLEWANLSSANVGTANLSHALLQNANLSGAKFGKAHVSHTQILQFQRKSLPA